LVFSEIIYIQTSYKCDKHYLWDKRKEEITSIQDAFLSSILLIVQILKQNDIGENKKVITCPYTLKSYVPFRGILNTPY